MLKAVAASSGGGAASGITIGTSVITGGTDKRLFYDNNGVVGETAQWTYNNSSGLLLGNENAAAAPTAITDTAFQIVGADTKIGRIQVNSFGAIAAVSVTRANGTGASPTAIVSGDQIGGFNSFGYRTSGGAAYSGPSSSVQSFATENWTSTANGTKIVLATTPNLSTTLTTALTVDNNQSTTLSPANDVSGLVLTGGSITGSGTTPFILITGTWNTSAASSAIRVNLTNTASAANATFADFQLAGTVFAQIDRSGVFIGAASGGGGGFKVYSSGTTAGFTAGWPAGNASNIKMASDGVIGWTASNATAVFTSTISQVSAGLVQLGTTTNNALGSLNLTNLTASGNVTYSVAASGPILKQGANGRCGTFVANGVTPVTVSNTSVAITDAIIISLNTVGGTVGANPPDIQTITAGVGFTVAGLTLDTSTYNYAIIKNAA